LQVDELDALKQRLAKASPLPRDLESKVDRLLEPRFLYASSAIEDRQAMTLEETSVFLERGVTCAGRTLEEFYAIAQHRIAFRSAVNSARASARLDLEFVRSIHRQSSSNLTDKDYGPGQWKTRPNKPATRRGRQFRYASPEQVPDLMGKLLGGLDERKGEHPLASLAWFYYHFHLIHPFNEANGRVLRILASFLLVQRGYAPLLINPNDRGLYLDALCACDATVPVGHVTPLNPKIDTSALRDFLAGCVGRTLEAMLEVVEQRNAEDLGDIAARAAQGQQETLERLAAEAPEIGWRTKAAEEVRKLHKRVVDALARAQVEGPLYGITSNDADLTADHSVERQIRPGLPTGGSGLVGQSSLAILPSATSPLKLPGMKTLHVGVAAGRYALHLLTRWDDEASPSVRHGPTIASQWSQAMLERYLAHRIDPVRVAYDAEIVERNRPAALRASLREVEGGARELERLVTKAPPSQGPTVTPATSMPREAIADAKTRRLSRKDLVLTPSRGTPVGDLADKTPATPVRSPSGRFPVPSRPTTGAFTLPPPSTLRLSPLEISSDGEGEDEKEPPTAPRAVQKPGQTEVKPDEPPVPF
jgi:fido (protein-threonine AMPylation protein)